MSTIIESLEWDNRTRDARPRFKWTYNDTLAHPQNGYHVKIVRVDIDTETPELSETAVWPAADYEIHGSTTPERANKYYDSPLDLPVIMGAIIPITTPTGALETTITLPNVSGLPSSGTVYLYRDGEGVLDTITYTGCNYADSQITGCSAHHGVEVGDEIHYVDPDLTTSDSSGYRFYVKVQDTTDTVSAPAMLPFNITRANEYLWLSERNLQTTGTPDAGYEDWTALNIDISSDLERAKLAYDSSSYVTGTLYLTHDVNYVGAQWGVLTYSASTPTGASITINCRCADTLEDLAARAWSANMPSGTNLASVSGFTSNGSILELKVTLTPPTGGAVAPVLHSLSVTYFVPADLGQTKLVAWGAPDTDATTQFEFDVDDTTQTYLRVRLAQIDGQAAVTLLPTTNIYTYPTTGYLVLSHDAGSLVAWQAIDFGALIPDDCTLSVQARFYNKRSRQLLSQWSPTLVVGATAVTSESAIDAATIYVDDVSAFDDVGFADITHDGITTTVSYTGRDTTAEANALTGCGAHPLYSSADVVQYTPALFTATEALDPDNLKLVVTGADDFRYCDVLITLNASTDLHRTPTLNWISMTWSKICEPATRYVYLERITLPSDLSQLFLVANTQIPAGCEITYGVSCKNSTDFDADYQPLTVEEVEVTDTQHSTILIADIADIQPTDQVFRIGIKLFSGSVDQAPIVDDTAFQIVTTNNDLLSLFIESES